MYELFKGGIDIFFYAFAAFVIIGAIVKKTKGKKKMIKDKCDPPMALFFPQKRNIYQSLG